jgi:hypothetical protein
VDIAVIGSLDIAVIGHCALLGSLDIAVIVDIARFGVSDKSAV